MLHIELFAQLAPALPPENVPAAPKQIAAGLAILALLVGGLAVWGMLILRWWRGAAAIEPSPRRPVPWRWPEVFLIVGFLLSMGFVGGDDSMEDIGPLRLAFALALQAALSMAMAGIVVAVLVYVRGASAQDLGLEGHWPSDLRHGAVACLAAVAPVYALQYALVELLPKEARQQHELIDVLVKNPSPEVIVAVALMAAVVAPLVEEFFFRILLQGWLEKLFDRGADDAVPEVELDGALPIAARSEEPPYVDSRENDFQAQRNDAANPYASPLIPPLEIDSPPPSRWPSALPSFRAAAPIAISSALFAAAHGGTWPDPLPIFLLALVLGYVYRQTHRLWPSVVAHMLFNSLSLLMLWAAPEAK